MIHVIRMIFKIREIIQIRKITVQTLFLIAHFNQLCAFYNMAVAVW